MPTDFLEQAFIKNAAGSSAMGHAANDRANLGTDRKELKVGTLTISSAMNQEGAGCEKINYNPLVMGDGTAATKDPVLLFRSPSYAV